MSQDNEPKIAHLGMIQDVITRMARNSFMLKGWVVLLIVALFGLAAGDKNAAFVHLAYVPTIVLWFLDAYYLRQERLFRGAYDRVRMLMPDEIDFSMATDPSAPNTHLLKVWCSLTLAGFYGPLALTILVVGLIAA